MQKLRYRVKSFDPHLLSDELVYQLADSAHELSVFLSEKWPQLSDIEVSADRELSAPVDGYSFLNILLSFKTPMVVFSTVMAKRLANDVYDFLKKRLKNGRIEPDKSDG